METSFAIEAEAAWASSFSSALDLPIGMAQAVAGLAALYAIMFESEAVKCLVHVCFMFVSLQVTCLHGLCMRAIESPRSMAEYVYHRYFQHLGCLAAF